jgi:hypothetical protein
MCAVSVMSLPSPAVANAVPATIDNTGMTPIRAAGALMLVLSAPWWWVPTAQAEAFGQLDRVPVVASSTCAGNVSAEAEVTPVKAGDRVENGVRVAIHYDAGIYDGSCVLTVTAAWRNLDTGASGGDDITAVSTIDGHYGFIGYANTTFATQSGTVVVTLSSHPGEELRLTV